MNDEAKRASAPSGWQERYQQLTQQDWPASCLFMVATPIGNLADLSLRAWQVLRDCDVIVAEDTRVTRHLLQGWGLDTPLWPVHRHNEAVMAQRVIERLHAGERVALVSDAGAPAVSDPGARMVRAVRGAGLRVVPIPGPSAVIAALMATGVSTDHNPAFVFAGFAPSKGGARRKWLEYWCFLAAPVVIFETPHRLTAALADLQVVCGPERIVHVARELTKRFEEVASLPLAEAGAWLAARPQRRQGEFVLIVEAPPAVDTHAVHPDDQHLMDALLKKLSVRDAARILTDTGRLPRDAAYRLALERSESAAR
ncbi:MAG TPA: 16S rRNA (cytidine(1402)-2'-O)-methyltransferase [Burkholderiaceae bacterium]|nr:16S rRNA (cytidine(1402)-2'-O)-methyltransferase [Burkholderiaceae bacterium]